MLLLQKPRFDSLSRQFNSHLLPQKWCVERMGERDHKVIYGESQLSLAE